MLPDRDLVASLTNFEDGAGLSVGNYRKPITRDFKTCSTCSDKFPLVMGLPDNAVYFGRYEDTATPVSNPNPALQSL